MTTEALTDWRTLYGALAAAATIDLEDVHAAREALVAIDQRWADNRFAWSRCRGLADYAYERKRAGERAGGRERTVSTVAYYTAVRLQDELRQAGLRRTGSAA